MVSDIGAVSDQQDDVYNCTIYSNDESTWKIGYILQEKTTKTLNGCNNFINQGTSATWDPNNDLSWNKNDYDSNMNIKAKSIWYDTKNNWITSNYGLDQFGNINKIQKYFIKKFYNK